MLVVNYVICLSFVVLTPPSAFAQVPGIIDTHGHIQSGGHRGTEFRSSLDAALRRMDQVSIRRIIIMPPPMVTESLAAYDIESYGFAKEAYAGRILLGGGGGSLNVTLQATAADTVTDDIMRAFRTRAEQIVAAGAVVFGEIALHHMSLRIGGPHHPYESTPADHPLLMLLADIAAEKNIPMDLHLDLAPEDMKLPDRPVFNPTNPPLLKANMAAFERLLAHNRAARIVWAHAGSDPLGTRTPQIQRELLSRNPNLFMSLRLSGAAPAPFFALAPNKNLKPIWLALFRDYPDRFVIGTDFFHAPPAGSHIGVGEELLQNYRATLAQMPPELAIAIAHGNAEKIYRLGEH
jgi:predicted TIM-barrel fold metal-dependent hydrolase